MSGPIKRLIKAIKALHEDEQGANMVEYILVIAAIGLPLLGLVLSYRHAIEEWISNSWTNATAKDTGINSTPAAPSN